MFRGHGDVPVFDSREELIFGKYFDGLDMMIYVAKVLDGSVMDVMYIT